MPRAFLDIRGRGAKRACLGRLAAFFIFLSPRLAAAGGFTVLSGHVLPRVRTASRLDRAASTETIRIGLAVRVDPALLDQTVAQIYAQSSGSRHYLTSAEFAAKFGLADKRQALKDFAQANGLAVDASQDDPNSMIVYAAAPVASVEQAFQVQLYSYLAADGRVFRAHDTDPTVPSALLPHLGAILGLSSVPGAMRPHFRRPSSGVGAAALGLAFVPAALSPLHGTGSNTLAPSDIKNVYGISGALNGSGQTMALVEYDGYSPSDISLYTSKYGGIAPTYVSVDGQANLCGSSQNQPCNASTLAGDGNMIEPALDIEMAVALAPSLSKLLVYTAPNNGTMDPYNKIATDNLASAVSTSWGTDETSAGGAAALQNENTAIFQRMAAQGQSMFASAGDQGAFDSQTSPTSPAVDDPCSQPNVTCVGGTSLSGTIGVNATETVWNNTPGCSSNSSCQAGGGGVSAYWSIPGYQQNIPSITSTDPQFSTSFRNVPDVALNADPNSAPYDVCVGGACGNQIGGTSAAAPLWAGLAALANQQRSSLGLSALGAANADLYALGASASHGSYFNDVTSGNNGRFNAGSGYDNASGWGSFKGNAMISALTGAGVASNFTAAPQGVSSVTWTWSAATNAGTYNIYNGTNTSQLIASGVASPSYTWTGLSPNILYSIDVVAVNGQGITGAGVVSNSTYTLAAAPGGAPISPVVSLSGVSFTVSFTCPGTCSGYEVEASQFSNFSSPILQTGASGSQITLTVPSAGCYWLRFATLNAANVPNFGPMADVASSEPPSAASAPLTNATVSGVTANWTTSGQAANAQYTAQISLNAPFNPVLASSVTLNASAVFGALQPNTSYYFNVSAAASGGCQTSATNLGSTYTLAQAPAGVAAAVVGVSSVTATWGPNSDPVGTVFTLQASANSGFSTVAGSSATILTTATVSGLSPNTTYYLQAKAQNGNGISTAFTAGASTWTLAAAPAGLQLIIQSSNSVLALWSPSGNPAGTYYEIGQSTDNFTTVFSTPLVFGSTTVVASGSFDSFLLGNLKLGTTNYVRVRAMGWNGIPTAFATAALPPSLTQSVSPTATSVLTYSGATLTVPPSAFTAVQQVTLQAPTSFPSAASNAGLLSPTGAGINITTDLGLQPVRNLSLTLSYAGAAVTNASRLVVARFDPVSAAWVPLPSIVDTSAQQVSAVLNHLSLYQVMQQSPAASLGAAAITVFPDPVYTSRGQTMSFTGLPSGASLTIYTFRGDKVRSLTAGPGGMAAWDGKNDAGLWAASGVYLVLIQSGGQNKTLKVMVER